MTRFGNLPTGSETIPFVEQYLQVCQQQLPPGSPAIKAEDVTFSNRYDGDGKYQLLYNNSEQDVFCAAEVNWKDHEITVVKGKLSKPKDKPKTLGAWELTGGCDASKKIVGEEEFQGAACQEPQIDPTVDKVKNTAAFQAFQKQCTQLLGVHGDKYVGQDWSSKFDLNRVKVINDVPKDGNIRFVYENPRQNFFCEGMVDSLSHHLMINHRISRKASQEVMDGALELTDACTVIEKAAGKDELVGQCIDKTKQERSWEQVIGISVTGLLSGLAWYQMGKWAYRFLKSPRGVALRNVPWLRAAVRNAPFAYLGYKIFDSFAGSVLKLDKEDPVRKYGSYAAGGAGLIAPEILKRTVATRLAQTSLLSRAGGAASRLGVGALLVGAVDFGAGLLLDDYDKWVNQRTTDRIYDKWVYSFQGVKESEHWYDAFAVPLMPIRAGSRWLAPNMMDWAVTKDNGDIKKEVLAEDRSKSHEAVTAMRDTFAALDEEDPKVAEHYRKLLLETLQKPVVMEGPELGLMTALQFAKPDLVRQNTGWSEERWGEFTQKALAYRIQQDAKHMISIQQDNYDNNWAREVFNTDGTLRAEMQAKFLDHSYVPGRSVQP